MSRVFLISDLHFGHKNIIGFTSRGRMVRSIEEHDELLIENWNAEVNKHDVVYVLGDVAWRSESAEKCLPRLRGKKFLVSGNHDVWRWVSGAFGKIYGAKEIDGSIMTHIPIHPQELYAPKRRWEFNIHGHLHDEVVRDASGNRDPNYINVCCEHVGMRPVLLESLLESARALKS